MTKHLSYVIIFSHRNIGPGPGPGPDQCHFLDANPVGSGSGPGRVRVGSGFGSDPMGSSYIPFDAEFHGLQNGR